MLFDRVVIALVSMTSASAALSSSSGWNSIEQDISSILTTFQSIATALANSPNETAIGIQLVTLQTTVQNATTDAQDAGTLSPSESATVASSLSTLGGLTQGIISAVLGRVLIDLF